MTRSIYPLNLAPEASADKKTNLIKQVVLQRPHLKTYQLLLIWCLFLISNIAFAQSFKNLNRLDSKLANVYFSSGTEVKAKQMSARLNKVIIFYEQHLQFKPSVTLLVLSPQDWSTYTKFPFYGMPHYTNDKTLIVASDDNDYWKSMVPALEKIPEAYIQLVKESYSNPKGGLTMEPFFDLLAIHELGHAYQNQGGLVMQRKWMGELFANILLHTYIVENEPDLLPALTTFPKMVVATTDKSTLKYTTLTDLETYYNVIGPNYPENYGWYQCRWHIAAGEIYEASNIQGLKKLWQTFKTQKKILSDAELGELLEHKVDKSVADVPRNWNNNN